MLVPGSRRSSDKHARPTALHDHSAQVFAAPQDVDEGHSTGDGTYQDLQRQRRTAENGASDVCPLGGQ